MEARLQDGREKVISRATPRRLFQSSPRPWPGPFRAARSSGRPATSRQSAPGRHPRRHSPRSHAHSSCGRSPACCRARPRRGRWRRGLAAAAPVGCRPARLAPGRQGPRRSEQCAKILERDLDAADVAQEAVHLLGIGRPDRAVLGLILKQTPAGKLQKHGDGAGQFRRRTSFSISLPPLALNRSLTVSP